MPIRTVTVTATLQNISGAAAATGAKVRVTLCGYSGSQPEISGYVLADIAAELINTGSAFSFPLIPNDIITPAGTFYCVQTYDAAKNCIAAVNYQIASAPDTQDLSDLTPYDPFASLLVGLIPNGPRPGNKFILPIPASDGEYSTLRVNGALQGPDDFEISGRALTLKGFQAVETDDLFVQAQTIGFGGDQVQPFVAIANGRRPGKYFTVPTAPKGAQCAGVYVNGVLQLPTTYTLIPGVLILTVDVAEEGDVLLLYVTSPYTVAGAIPDGDIPGTVYTLPVTPRILLGLYVAGLFARPGVDFTLQGPNATFFTPTNPGDKLYAYYLV